MSLQMRDNEMIRFLIWQLRSLRCGSYHAVKGINREIAAITIQFVGGRTIEVTKNNRASNSYWWQQKIAKNSLSHDIFHVNGAVFVTCSAWPLFIFLRVIPPSLGFSTFNSPGENLCDLMTLHVIYSMHSRLAFSNTQGQRCGLVIRTVAWWSRCGWGSNYGLDKQMCLRFRYICIRMCGILC